MNGFIHHSIYFFIVFAAVVTHQTPIFALLALLELPTWFLALANVFPEQRSDWLFAGSFLATRIALHAWIAGEFVRWAVQGGSRTGGWKRVEEWGGVFFVCLAFPL